MEAKKMNNKKIEIELGISWWMGISFAGGCFTNNWIPFIVVIIAHYIMYKSKEGKNDRS